MEVFPVFLKLGQSVNLEGFGTFRVSVTSERTAIPEELNARHVKGVKLLFLPSPLDIDTGEVIIYIICHLWRI
jgi:hypothetical protein